MSTSRILRRITISSSHAGSVVPRRVLINVIRSTSSLLLMAYEPPTCLNAQRFIDFENKKTLAAYIFWDVYSTNIEKSTELNQKLNSCLDMSN